MENNLEEFRDTYFNNKIKEDNNKLLKEYYSEFIRNEDNKDFEHGAYKFLQFMLNQK